MRIEPLAGPGAYQTYRILAPVSTHWRAATCAEVGCQAHANGWVTILPRTDLERIRLVEQSGRRYVRTDLDGGLVEFRFEAGQSCFEVSTHRIRVDRDPMFLRQGGDWRGNPTGVQPYVHTRAEDWADDFATHQGHIADLIARG